MTAGPFDPEDRRLDREVRAAVLAGQDPADGADDHLSADQLADYSLGLHRPEEEELIQEHLTRCAECAEAVLGLAATPEEPVAGETAPAPAAEREWERLEARLRGAGAPLPVRLPAARAGVPVWALAASLAACAGLLLWAFELRRELVDEREPSARVAVADLAPLGSAAVRGGEDVVRIPLPAGAERLVLLLNLGELRTFPRYRIELAPRDGAVVWQEDEALPSETGAFSLDLPAAALEPGIYDVQLYGSAANDEQRLAVYRFELAAPVAGSSGR